MDQDLRDDLLEAAREKRLVYYGELAPDLGLDMISPNHRRKIGELLGEVSRFEVAAGRPMLSAIVVSRDDCLPGKGFFHLGQELGLVGADEDELAFAVRQLSEVFAAWS